MKALLVGNYGVQNLGDEALKDYFLSVYPEVEWIVVSAQPKQGEVPRLPCGVRSFFAPWWKTLSAIKTSDVVVFGGGTLFTDSESVFACILWWWHALWSRWFGKPIFLAFQGFGPFRTAFGRSLARLVIQRAGFISARDPYSATAMRRMIKADQIVVDTFDPILGQMKASVTGTAGLVIIPRANSSSAFFQKVEQLSTQNARILSLQPQQERGVADKLQKLLPTSSIIEIYSLQELAVAMTGAAQVVTQRFHGAVAALALNIPFVAVPLKERDKLDSIRTIPRSQALILLQKGEEALKKALAEVR